MTGVADRNAISLRSISRGFACNYRSFPSISLAARPLWKYQAESGQITYPLHFDEIVVHLGALGGTHFLRYILQKWEKKGNAIKSTWRIWKSMKIRRSCRQVGSHLMKELSGMDFGHLWRGISKDAAGTDEENVPAGVNCISTRFLLASH